MDDRARKAKKISSILQDYCDGDLKHLTCLDLGCSRGVISSHLAGYFKLVIGIDVDSVALKSAQESKSQALTSPFFISGSGYNLPFTEGGFDIVICAQVYEHVSSPNNLVQEIARILKPGGLCFFSGPNRLAIMEEHYWLPFLSWLPHSLASLYMKLMHRGSVYDAFPLTYWQLSHLWSDFKIHDYTLRMLREPSRFSVDERVEKYTLIKKIPDWLLNALRPFYPNYNWIVVKKYE
jgi:2-polyprenyl-3-methyl-5-hydroxy-6-metoxy-1,4-benzoquinol methylase